jgi:dTMP kinase
MIIAFEGMDASGKATHTKRLAEHLRQGYDFRRVTVMAFPVYDSPSGQKILQLLKQPDRDPLVLQALMCVNRYEQYTVLRDFAQDDDSVLILDRYYGSGMVYGLEDGLSRDWLEDVHGALPVPDVWLLLDIPASVSFDRRPERRDAYEGNASFLDRVRDGYTRFFTQQMRVHPQVAIVNANGPVEQVFKAVVDAIEDTMPLAYATGPVR